ncbi:MAG TPA: ribosome biogenesis factor YjgA [Casimicrobiaceae bacterium]|nr:ribosome biogenesis factor YjgA [Casimicrobiaceae bacterium]
MPRLSAATPNDNASTDVLLSKTRRKRAMHELQDLGVALVDLDAARLATLNLPENLVDAIALARTLRKHEARRRQLQYIGRLMRGIDPAPIRAALSEGSSARGGKA